MSVVWKIAPGENARYAEHCFEKSCISVNWLNDTNLSRFETKAALTDELERRNEGKRGGANSLLAFVKSVGKNDVIVANDGLSRVVGVGVISSDYLPPNSPKNPNRRLEWHRQVRFVKWLIEEPIDLGERVFNQPTLQLLTSLQTSKVKQAYLHEYPNLRTTLDRLFPDRLPDDEGDDTTSGADPYRPTGEDLRQTVEREIKVRRGQGKFRDNLLRRYGERCMVTGCGELAVLEAAHIHPYKGANDNNVENGLVLRSDIHTLFDLNLLGINPKGLNLFLHPDIADSQHYSQFAGKMLNCPATKKPSTEALQHRFDEYNG